MDPGSRRRAAVSCVALMGMLAPACGRLGFEATRLDASSTVDAATADADLATACGPSYQAVAGLTSRYRTGAVSTWIVAEQGCELDGGHLVVIDDAAEHTYVSTQGQRWIGFTDTVTEGAFLSVTGTPLGPPNYFSASEPNNTSGNEDCVESIGGGWNDTICTRQRASLCECDGAPLPATAWCNTDLVATCGDCGTACTPMQTCLAQVCR